MSNATITDSVFFMAHKFNQDLSTWSVSNVTNMGSMFVPAWRFKDLSSWDTSKVTMMGGMFQCKRIF